ncbi:MAG: hypothetical protein P8P74_18945 [Crocinitomicaceae bacterium]|nr:hypothetical protein [Crocinitomicaceae bacterium]
MKTFIILGALIVSTGAFAQMSESMKAEQEKAKTQLKQKAESGEKAAREFVDQKKDETTEKVIQQVPKGKELTDMAKDMIDTQGKEEMVDQKINETSAAAAQAKAKKVETEAEAEEMIETSRAETKKTITSIDEKMLAARLKLSEKLESGEMTQDQFTAKMSELMKFEERKNSIINTMK